MRLIPSLVGTAVALQATVLSACAVDGEVTSNTEQTAARYVDLTLTTTALGQSEAQVQAWRIVTSDDNAAYEGTSLSDFQEVLRELRAQGYVSNRFTIDDGLATYEHTPDEATRGAASSSVTTQASAICGPCETMPDPDWMDDFSHWGGGGGPRGGTSGIWMPSYGGGYGMVRSAPRPSAPPGIYPFSYSVPAWGPQGQRGLGYNSGVMINTRNGVSRVYWGQGSTYFGRPSYGYPYGRN